MNFHMALPVDAIFSAIDALIELAECALMLSHQILPLVLPKFSLKRSVPYCWI